MNNNDFEEFVAWFDIRYNAMDMRTIVRWNGRNLRSKENVSEHTHLVVACAIWLYDRYKAQLKLRFEPIIRLAMVHDACEVLRGDILSVTKDAIPSIREHIENEERTFFNTITHYTEQEYDLVHIADLLACYLFLKWESQYPVNEFAKNAAESCFKRYTDTVEEYNKKYGVTL